MRQVERPHERWNFALRPIFTGGEAMGAELMDWGRETFGFTINEGYGQTECNLVVGNCASIMAARSGSMGKPVPGHDVAIIDEHGDVLPPGVTGSIAVRAPDPVMFLSYWGNPEATADKFFGDWLLTGDIGQTDEDGYIWFLGRDDDVITSAGYRIGPSEIEDCLMSHPAVLLAAAIGKPDPIRTEIIKAFIVPNDGVEPDDTLTEEIRAHVRNRLSAHEYPREIEFVDSLPMTATGKIIRRELRARETQ
jgi:acetyl-CoA synthetase